MEKSTMDKIDNVAPFIIHNPVHVIILLALIPCGAGVIYISSILIGKAVKNYKQMMKNGDNHKYKELNERIDKLNKRLNEVREKLFDRNTKLENKIGYLEGKINNKNK